MGQRGVEIGRGDVQVTVMEIIEGLCMQEDVASLNLEEQEEVQYEDMSYDRVPQLRLGCKKDFRMKNKVFSKKYKQIGKGLTQRSLQEVFLTQENVL